MPNSPENLTVGAWVAKDIPREINLVRFTLPEAHYQTLLGWAPRSKRPGAEQFSNVVLDGLSEILAFFVPEVSFMDSRFPNKAGQTRLALYLLGTPSDLEAIQLKTETAINFWLANIYPQKPAEMRTAIANSAGDSRQWMSLRVSTALKAGDGVCASPQDPLFYSALAAMAVRSISGAKVRYRSGEVQTWIAQTPQSGTYDGIELVAFPPKLAPNANALFSEYITLTTASFPERADHGLHILAHSSMRNWGPITGYDTSSSPRRSLDLFMPSSDAQRADFKCYGHSRIQYKALVQNWNGVYHRGEARNVHAKWGSRHDREVFDIVRQLTGAVTISNAGFMTPVLDHDGAWILPRLAPGSGDRYLAGGSGVGWQDRSDIARSLDAPLAEIGLARAEHMRRIKLQRFGRSTSIKTYFEGDETSADHRRQVLAAMSALGMGSTLTLLVLHIRDNTPALIKEHIVQWLGAPDSSEGDNLTWADGLVISLIAAPGELFSQQLPEADTPSQDLEALTNAQAAAIRASQQDEVNRATQAKMSEYLTEHLGTIAGVGCAIVEMPASLRDKTLDPYKLGRRVLAQHKLLPKVVLCDDEEADDKYHASVADCFRMLGVVPFNAEGIPFLPAAIGVIQRNRKSSRNANITGQSIPVSVRTREGRLEGALPNSGQTPEWKPYALLVLDILTGAYERYRRRTTQENQALFANYINRVLEHLNGAGTPTLVFLHANTLRSMVPSLRNGFLKFDTLTVGNRTHVPSDLPNLTLVRINANSDELPQYSHDNDSQWTQGLFKWEDARRTVYGAKKKPVTMQKGRALLHSRHDLEQSDTRSDSGHRKAAALDEMCIIFAHADDDVSTLQVLTHKLRSRHTHYAGETRLPFPLHELHALSKAVNS